MIVLEEPFVPVPMLTWLAQTQHPVLNNSVARAALDEYALNLVTEEEALARIDAGERLYTNSENALGWVVDHVHDEGLVHDINTFKDKAVMRSVLAPINPDIFFETCTLDELLKRDFSSLPTPVVVKPSVGFASLGVYTVRTRDDWQRALDDIRQNAATWNKRYPESVVDSHTFILEGFIEGIEYAMDVFFDDEGAPRILNVLRHDFATPEDTSDRMYVTSPVIVRQMAPFFTNWLSRVNQLVGARNIPMHIEVRVANDEVYPIEFNPLRFMGLGGTDITLYAYGYRTYEAFLCDEQPDFEAAFAGKEDKAYSMSLLNAPQGMTGNEHFDYEAFAKRFSNVLYLCPFDVSRIGAFGYIYLEVDASTADELEFLKTTDLREFLR